MKKIIIIFVLILLFITIGNNESESLRIRVKANSDSYVDQSIKKEIVKIVVKEIKANDTKEKVEEKIPILKENINKYLNGKYQFSMSIKDEYFPEKCLNGKIIESGYYESLVIEIGKGKGKNWWTLLYPEYFNVSFEDIQRNEVEYRFYLFEKIKKIIK